MKKIVNISVLLFVVIAFSGFASASYVTDHHSKIKYSGVINFYTGGSHSKYKDIMSTNVVHYSKTHIRFHYKGTYQQWNLYDQKWHTYIVSNYYRDYKKISNNRILETGYFIQNGKYYLDRKWVTKTTRSVYSQYKTEHLVSYLLS